MEPDFDAPDYSLRYEKEVRSNALVVHCRGGFSLVNHALLDRIVADVKSAPERMIVLNLGGIRFMDSVGVGSLAAILKHTMANGLDLVLVSNDIVDQVLSAASLNQVLRTARSLEEALRKAAP
ncbi:MAG: anti-sigma factor antagonist [Acidobacteria bacterium]|nr:anti-sigma factor antagonist [Acidobacteriota bacterium]